MPVQRCWWVQQVPHQSSLMQAIGNLTPGSIDVVRDFVVVLNYFSIIVPCLTFFIIKAGCTFCDEVARDNLSPKVCGTSLFLELV